MLPSWILPKMAPANVGLLRNKNDFVWHEECSWPFKTQSETSRQSFCSRQKMSRENKKASGKQWNRSLSNRNKDLEMKTRSQYRLERVRIADDDFQIDFDMYVDRDDDDSRHLDGDDWDNVDREHESAT